MATHQPIVDFQVRTPSEFGTLPGTLRPSADAAQSVIQVIAFDAERFVEKVIENPQEIRSYLNKWPVTWVNVDGLGSIETITQIGEIFGLHPLALEDVVNIQQRPKVEQYESTYFVIARMITSESIPQTEQMSVFLGKNFVITFQELPFGDCLNPVRERIRRKVGLIRQSGTGYLVYSILDAVIDAYFPVLEGYGELLEALETEIIDQPRGDIINRIHRVKREMLALRRAVWPLQEALHTLLLDVPPFTDEARIYLRDCYDHTIRIIELIEIYRDLGSDLMDLYLSTVGNRTNEIMRLLTVISTIFIPLTFIAGVYGMNFDTEISPLNMPELEWYWGYPFSLLLMGAIAGSLMYFFWQRGWLWIPRLHQDHDEK